jgi:hypothetical protein
MTQPPNQQPQWWQPPAAPGTPPPGQWPQNPQQPNSGAYPGQWQQQPQQPVAPQQAPWQPAPQPGTPPQGQFGGGFQPSQYGGLGAFPEDIRKQPERSKKPLIFGAIGVVVLAGAGAAAWLLGAFSGDTLEQGSLQDGVSKVLKENYGEHDVRDMSCPAGQEIKTGTTFDCTAKVAGTPKTITVRVLNDTPEYEVGAPH